MNGILIALEGIDGCGKSTLVKRLLDKLKEEGYEAAKVVTCELEKEDIFDKVIQEYKLDLKSPAYMFFLQVIHALKADCAKQFLDEGKIVIADRWDLSFFIYHENFGFFAEEPPILREGVSRLAFRGLKPHLGIYLDVSAKEAINRRVLRGEVITDLEAERKFYEKVLVDYKLLAQRNGWTIVNANDKFEQVYQTIWELVQELIK